MSFALGLTLRSVVAPGFAGPASLIGGLLGRLVENLPDFGVLLAAPKKRSSHQKKRQRQLAGNNQERPLRNLGRCPACGHFKRAHTLCMNCVKEIQGHWRAKSASAPASEAPLPKQDEALTYPKRLTRKSEYDAKLERREHILSRPRTLKK